MKILISFLLGSLFSAGLTVSGMVNPNKVIGFLNLFGDWDPDLIFVMGGAAGLNLILFRMILKRKNPLLEDRFSLPTKVYVDRKLVFGSILFGVGWGISGICPGPALANIFMLKNEVLVFIVCMFVGMFIHKFFESKKI